MPLPINIENLIKGRSIESSRLEYKEGWNPERVLHTICAFANDIEECGGGYIILGIREVDSRPDKVVGLSDAEIGRIEKELFNLCNLMEPRYVPIGSEEEWEGKRIFVIWAPTDRKRPFKCPVRLGKDGKTSEKAFFIRHLSNTVRANADEEQQLLFLSRHHSFDDEVNNTASINDIDIRLITRFLDTVGSTIAHGERSKIELLRDMRLIEGPDEAPRPLNIALMMFTEDPEVYFPGARIELVYKPNPDGESMEEYIIRGPLNDQLKSALAILRRSFIKERIHKPDGQAEATRVFNYPYQALEEILANAIYHRSYQVNSPIIIEVTPEEIEVYSVPGPDRWISDDDLDNLRLKSRAYRNIRLGDFLKELRLTEGRNTGIPKIIREMTKNGSPLPIYETDTDRTFLNVRIPIHSDFLTPSDEQLSRERVRRNPIELKNDILDQLRWNGCMSTGELAKALNYSKITVAMRRAISELMASGEIEFKYPDNPRHPQQKLCITRRLIS